jgi:4-hydroxybenzoate polyprenyltransferase
MGNMKNKFKVFLDNADEWSALFWIFVFVIFLVQSIMEVGLALEQLKYVFYSVVILLLFIEFSIVTKWNDKKNMWAILNVNLVGLILTYKEIFND